MNWLTSPAHARWLEEEGDALLEFARGSRVDGIGFGWQDDAGEPVEAKGAELWIVCRMTHVFALGALLGRPGCAPLVDHGLEALNGVFTDPEYGGWVAAVAPDGSVTDGAKEAYAHAFVILAASSAVAAGRPGAHELLDKALAASLKWFWDDEAGMVVDRWNREFTQAEPYRGVNANMHTVEAYLAAADVTGDRSWHDRAMRILTRVVDVQARQHDWRIPEHYDTDWNPVLDYNAENKKDQFRPYGTTPGHGLEWSRLLLEARAGLGEAAPEWMLGAGRELFARAVQDGWAPDGEPGFVYTVGWDGQPVVTERLHWVVAEGVGAAATLYRATGDESYARQYAAWWDYIDADVLDIEAGSWHHELDPHGRVSRTIWNGKPDAYHAVQATLIPRLPLTPALAPALAAGLLDKA